MSDYRRERWDDLDEEREARERLGKRQAGLREGLHDTVLIGGTVIDPASGVNAVRDIAVRAGNIAEIGENLPIGTAQKLDCRGAYVTPGLIDLHTHIFEDFTTLGVDVEAACWERGVVAAADGGSSGCWTFPAFKRHIAEAVFPRVFAFLNVAAQGILDMRVGELRSLDYLDVEGAVEMAKRHPDVIKGFKLRLGEHMVGESCLPALELARTIGDTAGLPLMLHIGASPEPLSQILEYLRPGDIVSHCYTGNEHGILEHGELLPAANEARERGVLFDSAHGAGNFAFRVARPAIERGFLPDSISSDNSLRNWDGPVFDLATTLSKFLALGLSLDAVVERATIRPAIILGIEDEGYGRIVPGTHANLTVLRLTNEPYALRDAVGETVSAPRLEPTHVVCDGGLRVCAPWRGLATSGR